MKIAELRKAAYEKLGREGVSKMALEFVNECDGSYKGVMELAGKLSVIAKMATFDEYWGEQVGRGEQKAFGKVLDVK